MTNEEFYRNVILMDECSLSIREKALDLLVASLSHRVRITVPFTNREYYIDRPLYHQIAEFMTQNKKIEAIKALRTVIGPIEMGLKEAKDTVENWPKLV